MSMSNETVGTENPIKIFLGWNGRDKGFTRKTKGEPKEEIGESLQFIVVEDQIETIRGYTEATGSYSSNVIRSGSGAEYSVFNRKDGQNKLVAKGVYKAIKETLPEKAKYNRMIYVYDVKRKEYAVLYLYGATVGVYFKHLEENSLRSGEGRLFSVKSSTKHENGAIKYYTPVLESRELDDNKPDAAKMKKELTEWDRDHLQPYLARLIGATVDNSQDTAPEPTPEPETTDNQDEDSLPF